MPYIPPEVVEQARQIDLLTYLQSCEPQELVRRRCRCATGEYGGHKKALSIDQHCPLTGEVIALPFGCAVTEQRFHAAVLGAAQDDLLWPVGAEDARVTINFPILFHSKSSSSYSILRC